MLMLGGVGWAVLYEDHADLTPEARIGFIGTLVGYVGGFATSAFSFYFPQND